MDRIDIRDRDRTKKVLPSLPQPPSLESALVEDVSGVTSGSGRSVITGQLIAAEGGRVELCLNLERGWNLISLNLHPMSGDQRLTTIAEVVSGLGEDCEAVFAYDDGYRIYFPSLPEVSDLQEFSPLAGYWVQMRQERRWCVSGEPVDAETPIPLRAGWNLIGYLPAAGQSPRDALTGIAEQCQTVFAYRGGNWASFSPDRPDAVNSLQEMVAGEGYWVNMEESGTLSYRRQTPTPPPPPTPEVTPEPTEEPRPTRKIAIDPVTRIEGHLRMEVDVVDGKVANAWSSGTMFRGVELVLQGRDPRDAWIFTQRICGVCTTVHALASVRAVENALGITVPDNARLLRNLIEGAQFVQDHVMHFYHLHALDWVDVVDALSADPQATSNLAQSVSDWPNSGAGYFANVQARLQGVVDSGQLGLFANGYWGHPAYDLPAEGNLLAASHYLEALDWQRDYIKMHAHLGGKNPHPQTYLVGGMASPVGPTGTKGVTPGTIQQMRVLSQRAIDFVTKVYLPDLLLVASLYPDWANTGGGYRNLLAFGDFPNVSSSDAGGGGTADLWLPRGVVLGGDLANWQALDQAQIAEFVAHSYYSYAEGDGVGKHPSVGETSPNFNGPAAPFDELYTDDKYSWLKAPRYAGHPMEVGPLARVGVAYAAGHPRITELVNLVLNKLGAGPEALFSTLGRVAARGIETVAIAEQMLVWLDELEANINAGDLAIHNGYRWEPSTWPAETQGWGVTEAPRGGLGHWVRISNGQIASYQMVVPTTWNGSPRDAAGKRGAWEEALIGTPVVDPERPVEILRTIHSFDPCMACSVHLVDAKGRDLGRVSFGTF